MKRYRGGVSPSHESSRGELGAVPIALLAAIGVGLAIAVALLLPWRVESHRPDLVTSAARNEAPEGGRTSIEVERSDMPPVDDQAPHDSELAPWRDADFPPDRFVETFNRLYYDEGGQEAAYERVEERKRARAGTMMEHHVANTIAAFQASGIRSGQVDPALFDDLVYGGDMAAGRRFEGQGMEYRKWVKERNRENYELPIDVMQKDPLDYPAEMWIDYYSGGKSGPDIPQELADEIAQSRNGMILQEALLYQETFYMRATLRSAALECRLLVAPGEDEAAFRSLHPEYNSLFSEMEGIGIRYRDEIRALMLTHGLTVE